MGTPEFQKQLEDNRGVSLARLISVEFGTSEGVVSQQLGAAGTQIEIDGVVWTGSPYFVPRDRLLGKTITVMAPERHWQMKYPETDE